MGAHHHHENLVGGRLKVAAVITAVIFAAELAGGLLTNSLALISDSAHVFMDVLALGISWFANHISSRPPTETRTFGLHRFEVFASLINGLSLLVISASIFYMAVGRLFDPPEVESVGMLVVAALGLGVNLFVAFFLKGVAHDNLNVRSAYLHVLGDAVASVGVIAGAVIIYYTDWYLADPLISIAIGGIIIYGALRVILDSTHILLEGVPGSIKLSDVAGEIKGVKGVMGLHALHIWSICYNIYSLSAHIDISPEWKGREAEVLEIVNERLAEKYLIFYTTLEVECTRCASDDLIREIRHNSSAH